MTTDRPISRSIIKYASPTFGSFRSVAFTSPEGEQQPEQPAYVAGDLIAGKYRLARVLGRGGMGEVWLARNTVLDVDVAIKLLRRFMASSDASARLLQEARTAARLGHPSIVRIFDFGQSDRGDPFIVMEVLEGDSVCLNESGAASICACASGTTEFQGACVDTMNDPNNCGGCTTSSQDHQCPTGATCVSGLCTCPDSTANCGATCANTMNDPSNCGACGQACPATQSCLGGTCECASGQTLCTATDTCANTMSDANNCGMRGHVCPANESCTAGSCGCSQPNTMCGTDCRTPREVINNCLDCPANACPPCCDPSASDFHQCCTGLVPSGDVARCNPPPNQSACNAANQCVCEAGACKLAGAGSCPE